MYLPYISPDGQSQVLGHYMAASLSGAIAATPSALDPHASIRWAPTTPNAYLVLLRIKIGWECLTAITTAVRMAYQASIVRSFTVDFTTSNSALDMSKHSGMMRTTMGTSLMGANGPRGAAITGALSGNTYTLDTSPFAITNWSVPGILTGTVSTVLGVAGNTQTLYERTADGQHPVVLAANEGVVVQLVHTGWASGTVSLCVQWEWAEVLAF